ncbi:MAG: M48 family metalloprotease [Candidatus Goldiibacteriota bacterium]
MVYEDIAANKRNTFFLFAVFAAVITFLGYFLGLMYGDPYTGVIIGGFVAFISIWSSYYNSDKIVIRAARAKPASLKHYKGLHDHVEGMALAAGMPKPKVYIINSDSINAFATGRNPQKAAIAVTAGLLKKLNKEETEAVIAHEMSHIKNYDILVSSIAAVLLGTIIILSDIMRRSLFFRPGMRRSSGGKGGIALIIAAIFVSIAAPFAAMMINFAVSRQREYMADAQAVLLTRWPQGLIAALEKIREDSGSYKQEDYSSSAEHMYFTSPSFLRKNIVFSTHPPLEKRIERLKKSVY